MISGSQEPPVGLVLPQASLAEANRVVYKPLPGIHGNNIDSFAFTLSDCVDSGEATTALLSVAAPAADSIIPFHTTVVNVNPDSNETATLDFTAGWNYGSSSSQWPFSEHDKLNWTIAAMDTSISVAVFDQETGLVIRQAEVGSSGALEIGVLSLDLIIQISGGTDAIDSQISIWLTSPRSSLTVRYMLSVEVIFSIDDCRPGTYYSAAENACLE